MFWKKSLSSEHEYASIEDDESVEASIPLNPSAKQRGYRQSHNRIVPSFVWQIMLCAITFFAGAAVTAVISPRLSSHGTASPTDRQCVEQLSTYSPILDLIEYEERNWTNSLAGAVTGYVGRPTFEMEGKWDYLTQISLVAVPFDKLSLLDRVENGDRNAHGSRFITTPPGNPQTGYIGAIEVFHHLHCLNALRQYIWLDSYDDEDDSRPSVPMWVKLKQLDARSHTDHCIDTLRQALMCNADVTPYLIYAGEDKGSGTSWQGAYEDFGAMHKCRKLEPLIEYFKDNGLKIDLPKPS